MLLNLNIVNKSLLLKKNYQNRIKLNLALQLVYELSQEIINLTWQITHYYPEFVMIASIKKAFEDKEFNL